MDRGTIQVLAALAFLLLAAGVAAWLRLGMARPILLAGVRAIVQLTVVGALIALIFNVPVLAIAFVAAMLLAAALTSGGRLRVLPHARRDAALAIGLPALTATGVLIAVGAFAATPRAAIPTAGILLGGAMTATTLTGRRLIEALHDEAGAIEARLALGDDVRRAVWPVVRRAVTTALVPVLDQTRTVGLVTLPGTFVGLLLGGASPSTAARTQLVVLLVLLAVELLAALIVARLVVADMTAPGERLRELPAA